MDRDEEIKLIAYGIWQEENFPDGRHGEHWYRAELIWENQQKVKTAVNKKTAKKKSVTKAKKTGK